MAKKKHNEKGTFATNRKARRNYEILDKIECGVVLTGTEVKSIRDAAVSMDESFAEIRNNEVFLQQMRIEPYTYGNIANHDPVAERKLLLHRTEIERIHGQIHKKGITLVPLKLYEKGGRIKVLLGLGRGKLNADKREDIKKKDADMEARRAMRRDR